MLNGKKGKIWYTYAPGKGIYRVIICRDGPYGDPGRMRSLDRSSCGLLFISRHFTCFLLIKEIREAPGTTGMKKPMIKRRMSALMKFINIRPLPYPSCNAPGTRHYRIRGVATTGQLLPEYRNRFGSIEVCTYR